jgi:hypothetical protein
MSRPHDAIIGSVAGPREIRIVKIRRPRKRPNLAPPRTWRTRATGGHWRGCYTRLSSGRACSKALRSQAFGWQFPLRFPRGRIARHLLHLTTEDGDSSPQNLVFEAQARSWTRLLPPTLSSPKGFFGFFVPDRPSRANYNGPPFGSKSVNGEAKKQGSVRHSHPGA